MKCLPTLVAVLVLLPVVAFGQDSTAKANATPFHKGQWAAQFQAGTAFGSLGFIKFRSPTRALVLDLSIVGLHSEAMVTDSSGTRFGGLHSTASTQVRFGWRRYNGDGPAAKVVSHHSFGALTGSRQTMRLRSRRGMATTTTFACWLRSACISRPDNSGLATRSGAGRARLIES